MIPVTDVCDSICQVLSAIVYQGTLVQMYYGTNPWEHNGHIVSIFWY